jgi:hypothetical protein
MTARSLPTRPGTAPHKLGDFRLIPQIEKYPAIVLLAQSPVGKLGLLTLFALEFRHWELLFPVMLCLGLTTFLPTKRRALLAACTLALLLYGIIVLPTWPLRLYSAALLAGVIGPGLAALYCARRWPESAFRRYSVMILLGGFAALLVVAAEAPSSAATGLLWDFISVLATYVWFIGYALRDSSSSPRPDFSLHIGALQPFWGSTNVPFPKGAAYLTRIEAKDAEQLAVTQLKGLKLLTWALLLSHFYRGWMICFHEYLAIPSLSASLAMSARGLPFPRYSCWASVIIAFFENILLFTMVGHRIIACCRMAGFNALRSTYRPLSSVTMAEFFNRFYFYFKELLVDFFFYPTFVSAFKKHRRLRLVAATFAAACFGNAYYHFMHDWPRVRTLGLWSALEHYQVHFFYCVALATALSVSQLRKRGPAPEGFLRGHLFPAMIVGLFYSLLNIFGSTQGLYPLGEHFRFLGRLFWLDVRS